MSDTFTARVATVTMAIALLAIIAVIAVLAHDGQDVPAVLTGALGLILGGLLPSPIKTAPTAGEVGHAVAGELVEAGPMRVDGRDIDAIGSAVAKHMQTAPTPGRGRSRT